jgi:hypothetical protein
MSMNKRSIGEAVQDFINTTIEVYRVDPQRMARDARSAERAAKDHVGRWFYELLQNSDDAGASEVLVIIEGDTIYVLDNYVLDNGRGLKPGAIPAICGTDYSDKAGGTIGRKGIGFKSVYDVSHSPQILTVNGEGVFFDPENAKELLQRKGLNTDTDDVPYQWIPFHITWDQALKEDPTLARFTAYRTIVRLPGVFHDKKEKAEQLVREWPPHALFAFRHLRRITAPGMEVTLSSDNGAWSLHDSRGKTPLQWHVVQLTESPPSRVLETLTTDERWALSEDGVCFIIAAPIENGCVVPTSSYLPVHVFYPTEQKSPVPLFLHAEFLVKSDRTTIIPVGNSPFNKWVAERLAAHVCSFVNDSYRPDQPSCHVALLAPFEDRESHPVTQDLWQRIASKAKVELRLADREARKRLTVEGARLISVSVRADLARTILEATSICDCLLHREFDSDEGARSALKELGCSEITDQELMEAITKHADSLSSDKQWVWACWEWLAAWVAEKPYGDEHKRRIDRVKTLPLVPVNGVLVKASDLAGRIVTWELEKDVDELPDWLPITFVENWLRDRVEKESLQGSLVKKLCEELGIIEPGKDVIQRALGKAIEQFWKDKQGGPGRFLRFILEQDWYETLEATTALQRCPVPLTKPIDGEAWVEARKTYFGREWRNDLLADLYAHIETVLWVAADGVHENKETLHYTLEWLGVTRYPRIIVERKETSIWQLPEDCCEWKEYLKTARDGDGRDVERVGEVSSIDHLILGYLDPALGALLIKLIAQYWAAYYRSYSEVTAWGRLSKERNYRKWEVKAKWWWEICERLSLPRGDVYTEFVSLTDLWLPDKRTEQAIGDLLPVVDLDVFGEGRKVVQNWLIKEVGLRRRIDELGLEEWKVLLSSRIPSKHLVSDVGLRDKVTRRYEACLDTLADQDNVSRNVFASCPLLCRKGDSWEYVVGEPRYLNDDNELAEVFARNVWLFHIPARLATRAEEYFGIPRLSGSARALLKPGQPTSPLPPDLLRLLNDSLPYIWAWRSSQKRQDAETLSARLKRLQVHVVPTLKAKLSLNGVHHEVDRPWGVEGNTIFIRKDCMNEDKLALALAKALDARSEADFYENLLRCNNALERKEKLLSKEIADAEVERCLREYSDRPKEEEQEEVEVVSIFSQPPVDGDSTKQYSVDRTQTQRGNQPAGKQQGKEIDGELPQEGTQKKPLRFKNVNTYHHILGSPHGPRSEFADGGGGDGVSATGGGFEEQRLTDEERKQLEKAGRKFAKRELEKEGYVVEEMPFDNPGFDLRVVKPGEELRVEVKAHAGQASTVEITQRQYREYLSQQGHRWELWNVEHLDENDAKPVTITRYSNIPDEALNVRTLRVNLKSCQ